MQIAGFQPLTLLDYPGKVAAMVFTQGCPFRCGYCHNPDLLPMREGKIDRAWVLSQLGKRRVFLDGAVVTGGEPTVHPDLPDFLSEIKDLGLSVKLDTNGLHPRMIESVLSRGLVDFLAMDLKHVWRRYASVIGEGARAAAANCRETAAIIRASGVPHEFRTTVVPTLHAEDDLAEIAEALGPGDRYALQEVRYGGTLRPDLPRTRGPDLEAAAARIRAARPGLTVEVRAG